MQACRGTLEQDAPRNETETKETEREALANEASGAERGGGGEGNLIN